MELLHQYNQEEETCNQVLVSQEVIVLKVQDIQRDALPELSIHFQEHQMSHGVCLAQMVIIALVHLILLFQDLALLDITAFKVVELVHQYQHSIFAQLENIALLLQVVKQVVRLVPTNHIKVSHHV